jgi:hypothetical protein
VLRLSQLTSTYVRYAIRALCVYTVLFRLEAVARSRPAHNVRGPGLLLLPMSCLSAVIARTVSQLNLTLLTGATREPPLGRWSLVNSGLSGVPSAFHGANAAQGTPSLVAPPCQEPADQLLAAWRGQDWDAVHKDSVLLPP